jgi:hypothetical protein
VMTASLVGQAIALSVQAVLGVACMRSRVGRGLATSQPAQGSEPRPA